MEKFYYILDFIKLRSVVSEFNLGRLPGGKAARVVESASWDLVTAKE